ncbi:putative aBC transporter, permease /ATP-binding protein [Burkholderia mallei]|nr:putative aBC transporter, permease /ATP-binding protein [Burkholderia mallei]
MTAIGWATSHELRAVSCELRVASAGYPTLEV